VAHLPSAEPLVKKARRVVAQNPDNGRGATRRDKASEEGDHETPADAKILPIGPDIKRENLARKKAVATVWATTAKTENDPGIRHRNANVSRLVQNDAPPSGLPSWFGQPNQIGGGEHSGIGRAPSLDIEPGDAARIS
jgi:hypothetical protein